METSRLYKLPKDILIKIIENISQEHQNKIQKFKQKSIDDRDNDIFCMKEDCIEYTTVDDVHNDVNNEIKSEYRVCVDCVTGKSISKMKYLCKDCTQENETKYGEKVHEFYLYNYQNSPEMYITSSWMCRKCIESYKTQIIQPSSDYHVQKIIHGKVYGSECGHLICDGYYSLVVKSSITHDDSEWYPLIKRCKNCK